MSDIRESVKQRLTRRQGHQEQPPRLVPALLRERLLGGSMWRRPALIWLFAACVPGLIISVASHFHAVGPLEKRLQEMQALQTAQAVDAVVQVRAAAVQIAASSIRSANLVETSGLDHVLQGMRRAFPDFRSMEILDGQGEILAMLGDLPLSEAARSLGKSSTAKVGAMSYRSRDLFRDDPEADSFVITARHQAKEGKVWFSRTRFARDPIKQALASAPEGIAVTLVPLADQERDGPSRAGKSRWILRSADIIQLKVPGWALRLEKKPAVSTFSWGSCMAVGIVVLVIGLAFAYRRFSTGRESWEMCMLAGIQSLMHRRPRCEPSVVPGKLGKLSFHDLDPRTFPPDEQRDRSDDIWTPRNVPLGLREPEVPEVSESALKLVRNDAQARNQYQAPEEDREGCTFGNDPEEACAAVELTQVELLSAFGTENAHDGAFDTSSSSVVANAEMGNEPGSLDGVSGVEIPEVLEVSWLEPLDYELSQFQLNPGKQP
jgi:hypothetical protein